MTWVLTVSTVSLYELIILHGFRTGMLGQSLVLSNMAIRLVVFLDSVYDCWTKASDNYHIYTYYTNILIVFIKISFI